MGIGDRDRDREERFFKRSGALAFFVPFIRPRCPGRTNRAPRQPTGVVATALDWLDALVPNAECGHLFRVDDRAFAMPRAVDRGHAVVWIRVPWVQVQVLGHVSIGTVMPARTFTDRSGAAWLAVGGMTVATTGSPDLRDVAVSEGSGRRPGRVSAVRAETADRH